MTKKQKQIEREQASLLRERLRTEIKYNRADQVTTNLMKKQLENLKGRKKLTSDEVAETKKLLNQAQKSAERLEKMKWDYKKEQSMNKLNKKAAEKTGLLGQKKALDYVKEFKSEEDKKETMLRYLGIGSNGSTLPDGSTYTQDDMKRIFEKYGIDFAKYFDEQEIYNVKYNPTRYGKWKTNVETELKYVIEDLKREREKVTSDDEKKAITRDIIGIQVVLKIYGAL